MAFSDPLVQVGALNPIGLLDNHTVNNQSDEDDSYIRQVGLTEKLV